LVSAVNYINLRVRNERTTSKNENPWAQRRRSRRLHDLGDTEPKFVLVNYTQSLKHIFFIFSYSIFPSTGRFIMFFMITNIYNNNNCSQPQENWKKFFWQLEMFDVCTTGDTAHIDTIFKF
jgi:hypothetical protein